MLNEILMIIIGVSGIIFGFMLSFIAAEEVNSGLKKFFILKRLIFIIIFLIVTKSLFLTNNYILLIIFIILATTLLLIDIKKQEYLKKEILVYSLYIGFYIIIQNKPLLASLIFLYGLPLGTLLKKR